MPEHCVQGDHISPQERGGVLFVGVICFPFSSHFDVECAEHSLRLLLRIAAMELAKEVEKVLIRQGFFKRLPVSEKMMGVMFQDLPAAVGSNPGEL